MDRRVSANRHQKLPGIATLKMGKGHGIADEKPQKINPVASMGNLAVWLGSTSDLLPGPLPDDADSPMKMTAAWVICLSTEVGKGSKSG